MGKSKRESADFTTSSSHRPLDDEDDLEGEDDDYPLPVPDTDNDDDYAFSSTSSDEDEEEGGGREGQGIDDEPWGLYRAIYAFEAIGEHELGLEEGDYVEIRGRGGGEGWVVAVRTKVVDGKVIRGDDVGVGVEKDKEKDGLVPETYLEKVEEGLGEG